MAITNNNITWDININTFEKPEQWGGTLLANTKLDSLGTKYPIYFTNLPIYIQNGFVKKNGTIDDTLIENHFNAKVNEIIQAIVRSRKFLLNVELFDLPADKIKAIQNVIYQTLQYLLRMSFQDRISGTFTGDGYSIETPIGASSKISEVLGPNAYTLFINSGFQYYDYDITNGTLTFSGFPIYARFATGQITREVNIDTVSDKSLMSRGELTKYIGNLLQGGRTGVERTQDLDLILDMDKAGDFLALNYPNAKLGDMVDITYLGNDQDYFGTLESYVAYPYGPSTSGKIMWIQATNNAGVINGIKLLNNKIDYNDTELRKLINDEMEDTSILALEGVK